MEITPSQRQKFERVAELYERPNGKLAVVREKLTPFAKAYSEELVRQREFNPKITRLDLKSKSTLQNLAACLKRADPGDYILRVIRHAIMSKL